MADQDFDKLLRALKLKVTSQRLAILKILAVESIYLAPEEIWRRMRRTAVRAGLPTVYRNLEELSACGVLIKILHPDRRLYYYFCPKSHHHHHFVCISCRKVEDLSFCGMELINKEVKKDLKGAVVSHLMQVYGHCKDCLAC
ncbi:MAG TPA: Fur family transcriptional regulator [Syntrophorhabdales bacterium]|nr:Fur family transcriptional regulator [Syntrophorhabdales bacterium]